MSLQVIQASIPLLEVALEESRKLSPTDSVALGLSSYLAQHIEEERGHDEWLREDLSLLGVDLNSIPYPSPHVASMVGAQFYWARYAHPVAILGYLGVLEGESPEESFFVEMADRSGLPAGAFTTLRYHARVDGAHWRDLLNVLDQLPLEPRHESLIGLSVLNTCQCMESAIRSVLEQPGIALKIPR